MLRIATAADAEAIFRLLLCTRAEIPLKIELERKDEWLDRIRLWCNLDHSWVAERDGKVVSVMLVGARMQQSTANFLRENGEPPREWKLRYSATDKDYRKQGLCKALYGKSVEPFETVYAQVKTDNKSKMAETLCRWGFIVVSSYDNGTIEFMLTRVLPSIDSR